MSAAGRAVEHPPLLIFRMRMPAFPLDVEVFWGSGDAPLVETIERITENGISSPLAKATTVNHFQDIDWNRLYKVLLLHAASVLRHYGGPSTFDGGYGCEDVVSQVLGDFFKSSDGLGWKAGKGNLETYLRKAVHNKLVDRLRRQKHVGGSLDDPDISLPHSGNEGAAHERANPSIKDALYALVKGDSALEDLIAATELIDGGPNVNQELEEALGKNPRQISKLKERLLAIDGVRELYAPRQAAKATSPQA